MTGQTRHSEFTHLSAESIFEVEVKERGWSLGSNSRLEVELVSLQYVVNVLGSPVDDGPEIITIIDLTDLHI